MIHGCNSLITGTGTNEVLRLTLVLFFIIPLIGYSQDSRSVRSLKDEANRYYEEEQYNLAIQYYRELMDQNSKDAEAGYRLADCYMKTFNYPEAEAYYLKVYYLDPVKFPLSLYYYALTLKFNASFDEAISTFDTFISRYQSGDSFREYVEQAVIDRAGCETAKEELQSQKDVTTFVDLNFNTRYNDYAPALRDSVTLVITSGRISSNRQSIDERFGEAFTDNYYFEKQRNFWVDKTKQGFGITNTRYNDGSGCFNSTGNKYYFTVCGMGGPQCRIFVTSFSNNKWNEPVALNEHINYKSFESKHPAISHGGDTLVFSTNRPGGAGKFDLWMSVNSGGEAWGPPMNLGDAVNTKLNELSPAFTAYQNVLFFSSDGHEGYGGLDLYMAKRLSSGETILYNLGSPFNSNRDDCFPGFSPRELFWSSNRLDGLGGFDIKCIKIPSVLSFISKLSLKKRNASRIVNLKSKGEVEQPAMLQASRLEETIDYEKLTYDKKKIVDEMVEDRLRNRISEPDQFDIRVSESELAALRRVANDRYRDLILMKKGYLAKVKPPSDIQQDMSVVGVLVDSLTNDKLVSCKILLTDQSGEIYKITKTNDNGKFKFSDVPANVDLYLRLEKNSGHTDLIAKVTDLSVVSTAEQQIVHFENIYFDFDHYSIRAEARKVLDELADHLIRNPGVQIEIFAYADDRGTNEYNLQLTRRRGQSVAEYLAGKGVDQTSVAIVAKGKQAQREVDVELLRQFNRRVEFYLNGNAGAFIESAHTYILKRKTDWATLALETGVPQDKLKALNGVTNDDQLNAFQPVRIPFDARKISSDLFFIVI